MAHWATAPIDRNQIVLFAPTLDQSVREDHAVRLLGETLDGLDFARWESMYIRVAGQPPIHPRHLAACILYGLSLGIRSSRKLEDAAGNRIDFIWLLEGRVPDHSTLCKFRTDFGPQIKALFRQVGRVAIDLGLIALNQVMLDGTDVKANNSRYATNRRPSLTQKLEALDQQVERMLSEARQQDKSEDALFGESTPSKLPRSLRELKIRQGRLRKSLENLEQLEAGRGLRQDDAKNVNAETDSNTDGAKETGPAKETGAVKNQDAAQTGKKGAKKAPAIPITDPDARVLPAKTGGYAPAYTAVLATDAQHGMIVDVQVLAGNDEASSVMPALDGIEESFNRKPNQMAADSGFNTGQNLAGLDERQVEALMPPRQEIDASAAERPDPSQPVAAERQADLPVNPQNKVLDRSAFVYDAAQDRYHCPMGRVLERTADKPYSHNGHKGTYRVYESASCAGCPLAARCLRGQSPVRRVCRDEHEELREAMAARMKSDAGRAQYRRRAPVAETAFAVLKSQMNFRQFLLRGLEKVKTELSWAATAFNLRKLIRLTAG